VIPKRFQSKTPASRFTLFRLERGWGAAERQKKALPNATPHFLTLAKQGMNPACQPLFKDTNAHVQTSVSHIEARRARL
jgi:hypothetical protein